MFQEAQIEVKYGKLGLFGGTGSGKTTTAAKLAIAVSKLLFNGAPVAMIDTEKGSDFVKPLFDVEGIKLLVVKTRAFSDLKKGIKEAKRLGSCVVIVDSMTHFWVELVDAYCKKNNIVKPEFHHWKTIKGEWAEFTADFINSEIYVLALGRAGSEYAYYDADDGKGGTKKELTKTDTKFKAEGEFGYETDLLIEMVAASNEAATDAAQGQQRGKRSGAKTSKPKAQPSMVTHYAIVRKCRVWALNGKMFSFPDQDVYKAGDYKREFDAFKPFFDFLGLAKSHKGFDDSRNSQGMFDRNGQSEYYERKQKTTVALEEIEGALNSVWSAATGKDAAKKLEIIEAIFGTRSWVAVTKKPLDELHIGMAVTRKMVQLVRTKGDAPEDVKGVLDLVKQAKDEITDEQSREPEHANAAAASGDGGDWRNE